MKKACFLIFIFSVLTWNGSAFGYSVSMVNFGSDDVSNIQVMVDDIAGGAKITVDVSSGPIIADITGVFFDLQPPFVDPTKIGSLSPSFAYNEKEGAVSKAPNNSNMGGSISAFDVGVAIGATGLSDKGSPDDFQTVMFSVFGEGLDASDFTRLGVRLQSVGTAGSSRGGSAKYVGTPNPVPESTTAILLGMGLIGLAGLGRKKFRKS